MMLIFISSFIASLAYCATPGVINAEGIRRGLDCGFRASMNFQMGAMASDAFWAIVTLSGLVILRPSVEGQILIGLSGGLLKLGMAWGILRKAWQERAAPQRPSGKTSVLMGALLALANPFTFLFWLSVGGELLPVETSTSPLLAAAIIVVAFALANILWSLFIAAVATYGRSFVRPATVRWINTGAGRSLGLSSAAKA
jgi:threonine/homoserine/homoserine lactone efflux protein